MRHHAHYGDREPSDGEGARIVRLRRRAAPGHRQPNLSTLSGLLQSTRIMALPARSRFRPERSSWNRACWLTTFLKR
jgi:hypothetical protein